MSEQQVHVHLDKTGTVALTATAGSGGTLIADGKAEIGGEDLGMRPVEILVSALGSCTAMDVMFILRKQKEPIERLAIDIDAERAPKVPFQLTKVHMRFVANPEVDVHKLQRAVALSEEKYCTVRHSLSPDIQVTFEAQLEE